jgi:hypothetical protein
MVAEAPVTETENHLFCSTLWDPVNNFIEQNGYLPQEAPRTRVRCPSIFLTNKWTIRHLSPKGSAAY